MQLIRPVQQKSGGGYGRMSFKLEPDDQQNGTLLFELEKNI
jgi:hypothetical protein